LIEPFVDDRAAGIVSPSDDGSQFLHFRFNAGHLQLAHLLLGVELSVQRIVQLLPKLDELLLVLLVGAHFANLFDEC
jgi:hypothetical protein